RGPMRIFRSIFLRTYHCDRYVQAHRHWNLTGSFQKPISWSHRNRFHQDMEKVSFGGETLLRWRVGHSTFLALPEKGARLMNWNIALGDGSVRDVLYWPEDADLSKIASVRGGNPILFPFNARSYDRGDIHFWRAADG